MSKKISVISSILIILVAAWVVRLRVGKEFGDVVGTNYGSIQGVISRSRDGREFQQWLGIPYAQPPVGELRFSSPKPPTKWDGIRDGSNYGPMCAQVSPLAMMFLTFMGDEDCLFLNVYVPKTQRKKLPVIVYIHGGGFVIGASHQYQPDYFMDEDVIFVTINYRLTLFGFLNTGDKSIRGNMGLKDQVLALKWIKENIEYFGGDPNEITLFGTSAGGCSTHYLLLSPLTKGLFKKAISSSGVASLPWSYDDLATAKNYSLEFAKDLNCPIENSQELVKCLRGKGVKELVDASKMNFEKDFIRFPDMDGHNFRPSVEAVEDEESFLTEHPLELVRQGKQHRIPWLSGINANEGLLSSSRFYKFEDAMHSYEVNWQENVLRSFNFPTKGRNVKEIASQLRDLYLPTNGSAVYTHQQRLDSYTQLFSDTYFMYQSSLSYELQKSHSPLYLYYYNRRGGPSITSLFVGFVERFHPIIDVSIFLAKIAFRSIFRMKPVDYGVCHGDELAMLFVVDFIFHVEKDDSSLDYKFSKDMVKLWVQFAVDETAMNFRGVDWEPQRNQTNLRYLELNESPKIIDEPFRDRVCALNRILKL